MTKRIALLSVVIVALVLNVVAQNSRNRAPDPPSRFWPPPTRSEFVPSRLLFYRLVTEPVASGAQKVEFQVRVDGQPHLAELITVSSDDARLSPAIEFLAKENSRLEAFYGAAAEGRRIDVTVVLNGKPEAEFSFEEFVSYNNLLKSSKAFSPISTKPRVFVLRELGPDEGGSAPQAVSGEACQDWCDEQYESCAAISCGGATQLCSPCLQAWYDCLDSCPESSEPPPKKPPCSATSTYWTRSTVVGAVFLGHFCLGEPSWGPWLYERFSVYIKDEYIRRTTYCDGRVVDTVLTTSYRTVTCDRNTFLPCDYPAFGFPFPPC
jgi:hypothetical protein